MNRRLLLSTALALSATASFTACAQLPGNPAASSVGRLMPIAIVDRESGAELPIYRARGEYWVAGRPGARYAIRARNALGGERLMAVMSVDGVNAISGETAGTGQTGYVFGPGERSDIAGWRKSDSQIAAFEFAAAANSYASRTGRPGDVGVIGVALFRERAPEPPAPPPVAYPRRDGFDERERRSSEAAPPMPAPPMPAPSAKADISRSNSSNSDAVAAESSARGSVARAPSLGTAHGRREASYIGHTEFERARSQPDEVVRIRYDSRENLVAMGVIPAPAQPRWPRPTGPSAFPGSEPGYVPDPPARY